MTYSSIITRLLNWKYKYISDQQFVNLLSIIIGLFSGISAVLLKNSTHYIQHLLEKGVIQNLHHALYFIFPGVGLLFTFLVIKYFIREKLGHGIPSTLYALSKRKGFMKPFQTWASLITAPLTVGFGGSVGLEGPTVATGAALGSNIGRLFHVNQATRTLLISAAAAGAMASIFKSPIAAIVFAVEVFSLDLTLISMIPLLLASITAVLTSHFFHGDEILFHFQLQNKFTLQDTGYYALLGIGCGFTSVYFSKIYFAMSNVFSRIKNPLYKLITGGALLGIILFFIPPLYGEGYEVINNLLKGDVSAALQENIFNINTNESWKIISLLLGLVLFKAIAMSATFGAGGIGGVFAPTLFTGSVFGFVIANLINHSGILNEPLSQTNFALVGMTGLISGVLQAPLTAIFLIAEITGGYELFIPLMITASISYILTKKFIPHTIYAAELAKRGELLTHNKDQTVLTLLDLKNIVEKKFIIISPEEKLGDILKKAVAKSSRNLFPVVDENNKFSGIILLDDIRSVMFLNEFYETTFAKDYMSTAPEIIIYEKDNVKTVMEKFQRSNAWNLPVLKENKYYGFISKSKLLMAYRKKLIEVTGV